jgi:crotonobetainyl-CoA:carnitine CoA-transferase CaiB-like acyl-CoA transferase
MKVTVRDPDGQPVELVGSPFHVQGATPPTPLAPPRLSQHTNEILGGVLGLDRTRLDDLRRRGVI